MAYVANARLPSQSAHSYQIVQMCDAFAEGGADVTLLVPDRKQKTWDGEPLEDHYDTTIDFESKRLPCVDFLYLAPRLPNPFATLFYVVQTVTFAASVAVYMLRHGGEYEFIYSRALFFAGLSSVLMPGTVVHESHDMPRSEWRKRLVGWCFDRMRGVVTISNGLKTDWREYTTVERIVAPDGVQLEKFRPGPEVDRAALKAAIGLPTDATIVGYAGTIAPSRGVGTLVESVARIGDDVHLCLVGGSEADLADLRSQFESFPSNVTTVGYVEPEEVPRYLHASDVLALPNTANNRRVARHSSPLKLFEYMASRRPIVTTELPAHREIVDESCAYFADPDDSASFAEGIRRAIADTDSDERVTEAFDRVQEYSWEARARSILTHYGVVPAVTGGSSRVVE